MLTDTKFAEKSSKLYLLSWISNFLSDFNLLSEKVQKKIIFLAPKINWLKFYSRLFSILQHASHIQDYSAFCSMHLIFKTIQHSATCISYSRLFSILQHASHIHKTYTVFYSIGFSKLWWIYIKLFKKFHYSFISTEDEKLIIWKVENS